MKLDENFRIKVTDFGFSEIYKPERRQITMKGTGTVFFSLFSKVQHSTLHQKYGEWKLVRRPPMCMYDCGIMFDLNRYSFGLILWELYTEEEPFDTYSDLEPFYEDIVVGGKRPEIPAYMPVKPRKGTPASGAPKIQTLPSFVLCYFSPKPTACRQHSCNSAGMLILLSGLLCLPFVWLWKISC